jgi:cytochrome c-type biogenesis protein
MSDSDLTIAVAFFAGIVSFVSPCVLPLVPAYLGQLTTIAVGASADGVTPSRWVALRHAAAYVVGFGTVFTILGVTATFAAGPLYDYIPMLRRIGGLVLIVMGLSLAGLLKIPVLERTWRPLDAGAQASLASSSGTIALSGAGGSDGDGMTDRIGSRLVGSRAAGGLLASFGLGAIFAIGWTPCIGIILGSILTLAAGSTTVLQGGVLLLAYTLGLGIPFLLMGVLFDRAPAVMRPLVRHGRAVSLVGGLLVVAIGFAMLFDWLALLPRWFQFAGV